MTGVARILLLGALAVPAPAATIAPPTSLPIAPSGACAIEGWSIDRDARGLNVRAAPSVTAAVVGRLPAFVVSDDGDYGPAFRIVAARDGWLRIRDANDAWRPSDLPRRRTYAGAGWVAGSAVRVAVQSGLGHASPTANAPILVDTGGDWLTERGTVTRITDCRGSWAKVRYMLPTPPKRGPRTGEAWFTAICGDQRTTCEDAGSAASARR